MSRQHGDIRSHPGHYLVDPYTWPRSPNGHGHGQEWPTDTLFVQCQSALPFWDIASSKFDQKNPWSKVKVTFDLETSKVKVIAKVKAIGHIWGLELIRYVCFSLSCEQTLLPAAAPAVAYEPVQKYKVTPGIPGWLNYIS